MLPRYADPGNNPAKEWRMNFWPDQDDWKGFEDKLNRVAKAELFADNELFRFMVNDARSMIENGCNWAAALSLLCFTEACGKYYVVARLGKTDPGPGGRFRAFLKDCMRCPDAERAADELYGDARCGLAHSFFLLRENHRLSVCMGTAPGPLADNGFQAVVDGAGQQVWIFEPMSYFRMFLRGLEYVESISGAGFTAVTPCSGVLP